MQMQFKALVVLAVTAVSMAAPTVVKRVDPFPTKATVWAETVFGDTEAYLTDDGKAWRWASETEPGPRIAVFDLKPVPITVRPGNLITEIALDGNTCRYDNELLDCSAKAAANTTLNQAFFQAKWNQDAVGDWSWQLLGPKGNVTLKTIKEELNQVSTSTQYSAPFILYARVP